jgi:peptidoglycan hydrolase-like protein with peptidoglycan-binding domain
MAKDSLAKASTPEPFSTSTTSNWVARGGGLPAYIQHIAHDIMDKQGKSESNAIQIAIGVVKRWAAGGGKVDANTRAAAAKAVSEWDALKAKAKGKKLKETADELADVDAYELTPEDELLADELDVPVPAPIVESPLRRVVSMGGPNLLEAAAQPQLSNATRQPGESLASWGSRLQAGDAANAAAAKASKGTKGTTAKTRTGNNASFEAKHPRGRGGAWTLKQGASGDDVKAVQRRVGAKADGQFGDQTSQAVKNFQRSHRLQVDGVVGAQTVAAMRGDTNAAEVKPGAASVKDRTWLAKRTHTRTGGRMKQSVMGMKVSVSKPDGVLGLPLGADMRLREAAPSAEDLAIHEQSDLVLVETVADVSTIVDLALLEAAGDTVQFNADGTVDFVILRPCNGRGEGKRIYEADMLARNAGVFAGWPAYDNHDSPLARQARKGLPRPPSELAGEIRESFWDPAFSTPQDTQHGFGQGAVIGRFMLTEDMEKLVRRLPRTVKTSVNAAATSMRVGARNGQRGMLVEGIANDPENSSVDLVTKAGAGGQVASLYRELAAA